MDNNLYELKNIEHFYGNKKVLDIKDLILEKNQIVGFLGPNGSGKSTLFSLLSFTSKVENGKLLYMGGDSKKLDLLTKQNVVILPQNPYLLKRSVFENITYGLKIRDDKHNLEVRVKEALACVGLDSCFAKRNWSELSGGEAQRVALSSRLILKPKVLILDEPTSAVDTNSAQIIKEAILFAKQELNTTILIASHDHNWLNHISNKKIGLFQGKIVQNGTINLLFAPWKKDENQDLYKEFPNGQKLIFKNTKNKKRDSVVMINSMDITLYKDKIEKSNLIKVVVNSISKEQKSTSLKIELVSSGVTFNTIISIEKMKADNIFPGKEVFIHINTANAYWI